MGLLPFTQFYIRSQELIQLNLSKKYAEESRKLKVYYLYGDTGTGKTYYVQQTHGAKNVCRITTYRKQGNGVYFDGYCGQPVLVFEEFAGQVPIEEMLNYLDIYPINLPARYADKVACYTTVYLTSNLPLYQQYTDIQREKPKTWSAFLRRIHEIIEFTHDGKTRFLQTKEMK